MNIRKQSVLAVIGGQYGSEGKGAAVAHLADQFEVHVRTGAPNAGHTFYDKTGRRWKMQSIPVGWCNPHAKLVIGRGALINLEVLQRELREVSAVDPTIWQRLYIDERAGVIDSVLHDEGHTDGDLHRRIGSTGEGVGSARIARLARDPAGFRFFGDIVRGTDLAHLCHSDTPSLLSDLHRIRKDRILFEGTQGVGLSNIHGPWPYVTSNDCGVASMASDAGFPPTLITDVLCVVRTYPIRVAGNSGPMKGEMTWDKLSEKLGRNVEERTTVTNKVRRVGIWDDELVDAAVTMNAPTSLMVNFLDYLSPEDYGVTSLHGLTTASLRFLDYIGSRFETRISLIGTGERTIIETGEHI